MNEQYIAYRQTLLKDDVRLAIYRNSHLRVFHKIGALKFAQNSQENAYAGVSKLIQSWHIDILQAMSVFSLLKSTKTCNCFGRSIMQGYVMIEKNLNFLYLSKVTEGSLNTRLAKNRCQRIDM